MDALQRLLEENPEAALKLIEDADDKVIRLHPGQQQVENSAARFKVLNAGRRWGKTKYGARAALKVSRQKSKMIWWVAPTYKVVKRGYREVLRQLPDGVLTHAPPPDTNFDAGRSVILRFKNGTRMEFYSAERDQGMLGEGVDFAVVDEAATMPSRVWEQIIRPTLMDHNGHGLLISTPRGRNWFYKGWLRGQDSAQENWDSWTFPTSSNPYIDDEEIEEMRRNLPRLVFEQEVEAKFIAAGSSVFFIPEQIVERRAIRPSYLVDGVDFKGHHIVLGIDLAKTTDFTVLYGASARTLRNVYYERMQSVSWREQKRRIRRAVGLLIRAGASGVTLIMDSTGVGDPIVEDVESYGFDVVPINFTTYKDKMVKLLGKDLEDSRAFVLEDGLQEFENYQMNITPAGRITYGAPEGEHDDVPSAKMLQHWGIINEGVPEITTVTTNPDVQQPQDTPEPSPEDDLPEPEGFEDLLDEGDELEFDSRADMIESLGELIRPPTPGELLTQDHHWSSRS